MKLQHKQTLHTNNNANQKKPPLVTLLDNVLSVNTCKEASSVYLTLKNFNSDNKGTSFSYANWQSNLPTLAKIRSNKKKNEHYLSDMVAMVLNAWINPRSALPLRFCHLPREFDKKSPEEPFVFAMTVVRALSARSGLVGPPTRFGSLLEDSLAKVRHSEVSSIEWDSRTKPHSEQSVSPAEWSTTSSVSLLQSVQYASDMAARKTLIGSLIGCRFEMVLASGETKRDRCVGERRWGTGRFCFQFL